MAIYEYLVIDYNTNNTLGVFDDFQNALIFIKGYYIEYYNEPNVKLIIVKQEKEDNLCHQN